MKSSSFGAGGNDIWSAGNGRSGHDPEVHFVDEAIMTNLGEDGGIFDPAHK